MVYRDMVSDGFDRRTIIQVVGIASVPILVGCLDDPDDDEGEDQDDGEDDNGPGY